MGSTQGELTLNLGMQGNNIRELQDNHKKGTLRNIIPFQIIPSSLLPTYLFFLCLPFVPKCSFFPFLFLLNPESFFFFLTLLNQLHLHSHSLQSCEERATKEEIEYIYIYAKDNVSIHSFSHKELRFVTKSEYCTLHSH